MTLDFHSEQSRTIPLLTDEFQYKLENLALKSVSTALQPRHRSE